jgi:hypothetical protein
VLEVTDSCGVDGGCGAEETAEELWTSDAEEDEVCIVGGRIDVEDSLSVEDGADDFDEGVVEDDDTADEASTDDSEVEPAAKVIVDDRSLESGVGSGELIVIGLEAEEYSCTEEVVVASRSADVLRTDSGCREELVEAEPCTDGLEARFESVKDDDGMALEALDDTSDVCDKDACDESGDDVDIDVVEEEGAEPHFPNPCWHPVPQYALLEPQ